MWLGIEVWSMAYLKKCFHLYAQKKILKQPI
jgi:hypothetical protein